MSIITQVPANSVRPELKPSHRNEAGAMVPAWLLAAGLICGFGIWFLWAPLIVLLWQVDAGLTGAGLFSLLVISGLSASCLRLILGYVMRPGSEPLVLSAALAVLTLTAMGLFRVLSAPEILLWQLQVLALLSGLGGGWCCTLASQFREPHQDADLEVELTSGLGHLGIVVSLLLLPVLVLLPLTGFSAQPLLFDASNFLGRVEAGTPVWLSWVALFWGGACLGVFILSWPSVHRSSWRLGSDLGRFICALLMGLLMAALGAWWLLPSAVGGSGLVFSRELVLGVMVVTTLAAIRFWPRTSGIEEAFQIFNNKNTWVMSLFWAMSLGSFLGFAAAFPMILVRVFEVPLALGVNAGASATPEYPGVFLYAWMLPLAAVLVRPLGTWCALRWGGARVTQVCTAVLTVSALLAALSIHGAQTAQYSPPYFPGFLWAFSMLFTASGVAYASLQSSLPKLFPAPQRRSLGVWLSSVSVLGVAYISLVFSEQLERGTPSQALYGFALFYGLCFLLNGWLYLRRHAPIYNP